MKRILPLLAVLAACAAARADRPLGFQTAAFCAVVPETETATRVFSPFAFELDAVCYAEAADPIPRAQFAEALGVLVDFANVYRPMLEHFRGAASSNGLDFVSARAFAVPDVKLVGRDYRRRLCEVYRAGVCPLRPAFGTERWLQAETDGAMEDFKLTADDLDAAVYVFYDLAALRFKWAVPFGSNAACRVSFACADGATRDLPAFSDVREGTVLESRGFTALRLPVADGAHFYALLPKAPLALGDLHREIAGVRLVQLLAEMNSSLAQNLVRGPVKVTVPAMSVASEHDLAPAFSAAKIDAASLAPFKPGWRPARIVQRVRFELGGEGLPPEAAKAASADDDAPVKLAAPSAPPRAVALDRPFLFFIHHASTGALPVIGQFTGTEGK